MIFLRRRRIGTGIDAAPRSLEKGPDRRPGRLRLIGRISLGRPCLKPSCQNAMIEQLLKVVPSLRPFPGIPQRRVPQESQQ